MRIRYRFGADGVLRWPRQPLERLRWSMKAIWPAITRGWSAKLEHMLRAARGAIKTDSKIFDGPGGCRAVIAQCFDAISRLRFAGCFVPPNDGRVCPFSLIRRCAFVRAGANGCDVGSIDADVTQVPLIQAAQFGDVSVQA